MADPNELIQRLGYPKASEAAKGWDQAPAGLRDELKRFLEAHKDLGTTIDTSTGPTDAGLHVTVLGIEYYVEVRRSNTQAERDKELERQSPQ